MCVVGKSMTGWNGSLQQVHLTHPRCACGGLNQHRFPRGISVWAKSLFSITQSCLTLRPHGLQHTRPPCPSLSPGVCSDSCPLSWWCHPLLPPSLPALNLSQNQGLFQWVSSLHQWPKYWSFSFSISPSNEYSVLISIKVDWFDLLDVQGTLKSLLQHHNSKASILRCSAFFMIQLSHDYWKNYSSGYVDCCWQSDLSAFLICCLGLS